MVLSVIVAMIACSTLQAVEPEAAPDAFDRAAFQRLAQQDRLAHILEAVKWREEQLQNFAYDLTERMTTIRNGVPADEPFLVHHFAVKRLGSKSFVHRRQFRRGSEGPEGWSSWDGEIRRERHRVPGQPVATGTIGDAESEVLSMMSYNEVLGYRLLATMADGTQAHVTLPEWLEHTVGGGKTRVEVHLEGGNGTELIALRIWREPSSFYQTWFDPHRDFLLVQEEYTRSRGEDTVRRRSDVLEAKQVDGVWVPIKVVQTRQLSDKGDTTRHDWDVSHFAREVVDAEDLRIDFPPGAIVVDRTKREAFRVDEDGTWVPTPLAEQPRPE